MKHCADYEERLNDCLDGLLSPAERAGLERHLEGCAPCREFLAAIRALREQTASLPRSLEPARDLWPGIREGLPGRRAGLPKSRAGFPAWLRGWGGLAPAAASVVLVILIAAAVVIGLRRSAVPPGPGDGGLPGAGAARVVRAAGQEPLEMAEAEYRAATEKLLVALQRERGGASPEALKVIEENLRIVERAIQEIHRAAAGHPGRRVDERMVTNLYRTRFELLRQAVRLFAREGEEKQS